MDTTTRIAELVSDILLWIDRELPLHYREHIVVMAACYPEPKEIVAADFLHLAIRHDAHIEQAWHLFDAEEQEIIRRAIVKAM